MRVIPPIILIGCSVLLTLESNSSEIPPYNNHKISSLNDNHNKVSTNDPNLHQHINNIHQFLLADLAQWRQDLPMAKKKFAELLKTTQDPKIAEILTELAINSEDYVLTANTVATWAKLDPSNLNAQLIAIIMLLEEDQSSSEACLAQAITYNPDKFYTEFPLVIAQLTGKQKILLSTQINNLIKQDNKDPVKYLTLAQINIYLHDISAASTAITTALTLKPDLTQAIFLQAKIIKHNTGSDRKALNYLQQQNNSFPKNNALRIFYANALFDNHQNTTALKILSPVLNQPNQSYYNEALLLAAEINMQPPKCNLNQAKKYLLKALNTMQNCDKSYLFLGQIAEQQADFVQAIKYYTLIENNPLQIIGLFKAALLLAQNQQFNLALDMLDQAHPETILEKKQLILLKNELALEIDDIDTALESINAGVEFLSEDLDFLYNSSITYTLANKITLAEDNLKKIIKLQPKNHFVLNNLGFILATNPSKYNEALNYLQQAVYLDPNNPMYLDHLGELLIKMGKLPEALHILTNAYKIQQNVAIAVHLGEALWASGEKQQATNIWQKAWQTDPNNLELLQVLKQHKVVFAKIN